MSSAVRRYDDDRGSRRQNLSRSRGRSRYNDSDDEREEDYSWGGPEAGDNRDEGFLIDEQARRRRTRGSEEDDPENPESYLNAPASNRRARPGKQFPPQLRGRRQFEEDEETKASKSALNYRIPIRFGPEEELFTHAHRLDHGC